MAVENKYVNADMAAGKKSSTRATGSGAEIVGYVVTFETAAADDDGSIYRLISSIPSNLIPYEISITCDTITAGTDWDLGLYKPNLGAVVEKDVLMDGQTLATALTRATGYQLGLKDVNIADATKTLAQLSGQTNPDESYDLALTANTVGTAAGTVTVLANFLSV
jgi:hypothetical protein